MDMREYLPKVPTILSEVDEVLKGYSLVACLEHMKWLGAFICIEPIHRSLVGAATTENEGFELVKLHKPDFLIVSQHLEEGNGMALVKRTEELAPEIKTLLIVDNFKDQLVKEAIRHGCDGVCFQSSPFMSALRIVAGGGIFYPEPVAHALRQRDEPPTLETLTPRELDVLRGLMLGLTDAEISKKLIISTDTVRTHIKHIYEKMPASNRTQAVVKGIALNLINLEESLQIG
jgi:DNA-binding NarL/FixJ family response regulator